MAKESNETIFLNSVFFVIGFVIVFSAVGVALQLLLSATAHALMGALTLIGGSVIIIFGVVLILSTRYVIPFFTQEYKVRPRKFRNSYLTSLVFGIAFAIGWTPCVGPILGSIYALAITSPGFGFLLLLAYSLGLAIPFLVFGAFFSRLSGFMNRVRPALRYFNIVGGILLVALGILVVTGYIGMLSVFLVGTNGYIALGGSLNFLIAIVAGLLTFLSPCILPLVPAYFSYMAGSAAEAVKNS